MTGHIAIFGKLGMSCLLTVAAAAGPLTELRTPLTELMDFNESVCDLEKVTAVVSALVGKKDVNAGDLAEQLRVLGLTPSTAKQAGRTIEALPHPLAGACFTGLFAVGNVTHVSDLFFGAALCVHPYLQLPSLNEGMRYTLLQQWTPKGAEILSDARRCSSGEMPRGGAKCSGVKRAVGAVAKKVAALGRCCTAVAPLVVLFFLAWLAVCLVVAAASCVTALACCARCVGVGVRTTAKATCVASVLAVAYLLWSYFALVYALYHLTGVVDVGEFERSCHLDTFNLTRVWFVAPAKLAADIDADL